MGKGKEGEEMKTPTEDLALNTIAIVAAILLTIFVIACYFINHKDFADKINYNTQHSEITK